VGCMLIALLMCALASAAPSELSADEQAALDEASELDGRVVEMFGRGAYAEARVLAERSLSLRRWVLHADHADVATSLNNLAMTAQRDGDLETAERLQREALGIRRRTLGDEHPSVALSLNNLGSLHKVLGDFEMARDLYEESLAIRRATLGENHPEVAASLSNLAVVRAKMGDYAVARDLAEEALELRRELRGPDHPDVASSLLNLAGLVRSGGDLDGALQLNLQALEIFRAAHGEDHVDVALALNNLAQNYSSLGDYAAANRAYLTSLEIRVAVHGADHLRVAETLNNLGTLLKNRGDYVGARSHLERALAIRTAKLGEDHPSVAISINNLASLLWTQGDNDAALPLNERCLEIWRATYGDDHIRVATGLNNLASVVDAMGDFDRAQGLYEEALAIRRSVYGDQHPSVANSLLNLSNLLRDKGDLRAAQAHAEDSVRLLRGALGDDHPRVARSLRTLALLVSENGDSQAARVLHEESLAIRRQTLDDGHPAIAESLNNIALLDLESGEIGRAQILFDESLGIAIERLSLLDGLSEREALAYVPKLRASLDGWLRAFDQPSHVAAAWEKTLRFKGVVAARARSGRALATDDLEAASIATELASIRRKRAALAYREPDPEDKAEARTRFAALSAEQERLERELMTISASYRRSATLEAATPADFCAALPKDTGLIDLLRYGGGREARYLAFVANREDCVLRRVELGPAGPIDAAVLAWHEVLRDGAASPARVERRGQTVTSLLWEPLKAAAGQSATWWVVPDGPLSSVPLGALPLGEGRYAIEDHAISYLDRVSDVFRAEPANAPSGALVVGGIDYDAPRGEGGKARSFLAPCNGGQYAPLSGAATEADAVTSRWSRTRKEPLLRLGGADATETAIASAMPGKAVVHLATHGFFATGACRSAIDREGAAYDPMLLSGLVFAGANGPPDSLSAEDGVMTAAEVAGLDLSSTGLVVLAACETGLGEAQSGQGVLGLRRAFAIAGARTLVMSLWSVSDESTGTLMEGVYRRHLGRRHASPAEALRAAQLQMLAEQRKRDDVRPFEWAAFIASGFTGGR